jgi:hypothetical protein
VNPKTDVCRRGFRSTSGFVRHKNIVHAGGEPRTRLRQHPYCDNPNKQDGPLADHDQFDTRLSSAGASGEDSEGPLADTRPEGPYYINHPILDGKCE